MLQRGRKSAESLATARVLPGDRPDPPAFLTEQEAALWREIAGSLPAGHFRVAELNLLAAYVQQFSAYLNATQSAADCPKDMAAALHRNASRSLKNVLSLARALRLTPSARFGPKAAETASRAAAKPWRT